MNLSLKIASHYAHIWFQQAEETDCLEATYRDVVLFKRLMKHNPKILQVLQNPSIPGNKKLEIFNNVVAAHVHRLTRTLFAILINKRREAYFLLILKQFLEQYNAYHHIQVAHITTAFKLPSYLVTRMEDVVRKLQPCKSVLLKERVDPTLLGGFILQVGDRQLDNSLARKLIMLKQYSKCL